MKCLRAVSTLDGTVPAAMSTRASEPAPAARASESSVAQNRAALAQRLSAVDQGGRDMIAAKRAAVGAHDELGIWNAHETTRGTVAVQRDSVMKDRTHIFLSPHLDDAAISCGGLISKLSTQGSTVCVVGVYDAASEADIRISPNKTLESAKKMRQEEDRRALHPLGVETVHLGMTSRSNREPPLKNDLRVFTAPKEGAKAYRNVTSLRKKLNELLEGKENVNLYCPLGAGNHFDHVEVFYAVYGMRNELARRKINILFYEDGYVLFGNRVRKRHPVTAQRTIPFWRSPNTSSLKCFIMSQVIGCSVNTRSIADGFLREFDASDFKLRVENVDGHFESKLKMYGAYESQMKQFGGIQFFRKPLARLHRYWGGEAYWVLRTAPPDCEALDGMRRTP